MDNKFYTYVYFDLNMVPIYVGKGHGKRAFKHIKAKYHNGQFTRLALKLQKLAETGVVLHPVLTYHETEESAHAEEIRLIALYGRTDIHTGTLYNLTNGGEGVKGIIRSQEYKDKQSSSQKKRTYRHKHTEEHKESLKGKSFGNVYKGMPARYVRTEEHNRQTKETQQNALPVKCPHCDVHGNKGIMKRWHFDRCKNKGRVIVS